MAALRPALAFAASGALLLALLGPAQADELNIHAEFFSRSAASAEVLETQRGGADQELNLISVEGALHSNAATNTVNGTNTITNGSFANANGMATAIQNSGNNVLIQNATILRIELR